MRITSNVIFNSLLNDINKNRQGLADLQRKLATGKDVRKPSDNPASFNKSRGLQEVQQRQVQYQDNIQLAIVQSRTVQNSMDGFISTMNDLKIKAVQASNQGVVGEDQINIIRDAVTTAKETLQTIGNTKVLNRYIFGGSKTETIPFENDQNGKNVYNGNEEELNLQVSDFETIPVSIPGSRLVPIFEVVERFEQALNNNDFTGIQAAIGEIDDSFDTITTIASDVGNSLNKMEFLFEQYELSNIEYQAEISRLTDTDYAEALSNLEKFNISYQAAIEANQRLINTSLVNLLR